MSLWYVMQVRAGTEENARCQCLRLISSNILEHCFVPYYQQKKRFQGEWHIQETVLFPGYVFLVTSDLKQLMDSLRKVTEIIEDRGTNCSVIRRGSGFASETGKRRTIGTHVYRSY